MSTTTFPTPPLLLEVHTERFVDAMLALESAGFEVAARPGQQARYVLRDARQDEPQSAG